MTFIMWIIVGGIAGWIGSKIMGTDAQMGLVLNVIVGVIGAFVGGWLLGLVPGVGIELGKGNWWATFFTAIVGACILLWIVGLITKKR